MWQVRQLRPSPCAVAMRDGWAGVVVGGAEADAGSDPAEEDPAVARTPPVTIRDGIAVGRIGDDACAETNRAG
jgi:hypothetical protein